MIVTVSHINVKIKNILTKRFQNKLEGYEFPVYSTKVCPRNQSEWSNRSSAINCTESNGYMCIPNENITDLLEFCYIYPRILIQKGIIVNNILLTLFRSVFSYR